MYFVNFLYIYNDLVNAVFFKFLILLTIVYFDLELNEKIIQRILIKIIIAFSG